MKRDIHSITDLVTGPVDVGDIALFHQTGGWKAVADGYVDIRVFGATGDGVTDDTTAMQTWATYLVMNQKYGFLPAGNYKISSRINIPCRPLWGIIGAGRGCTFITQATDNTPIFYLGSDTASSMHTWRISGISFTYTNVQTSAMTNANPIAFAQMGFEFVLRDLNFARGSYGIRVVAAVGAPWGGDWDELLFGEELSIGAVDIATLGTLATPNNRWGRILCDCNAMIGPVFNVQGYNWTIDTIEFIRATLGPVLITMDSGTKIIIGALKLEQGSYSVSKNLFNFPVASYVEIGHITIGGSTMQVLTPATVNVVTSGAGGSAGRTTVDHMDLQLSAMTGTMYGFSGSRDRGYNCGSFTATGGPKLLSNAGVTANSFTLEYIINHRMSDDKGNADYTVVLGDPNIITFETAFTAIRTVSLPSDGDAMCNGIYYEIRNQNAVNGANTLLVKCGATTLYTETAVKSVMRFVWRRNVTVASGWKMVGYSTLP